MSVAKSHLRGKRLNAFREAAKEDGKDIYVPTKTNMFEIFDFRAFFNMAMLLSESDKARALRLLMLDIVIDLINRKTGSETKYINQIQQMSGGMPAHSQAKRQPVRQKPVKKRMHACHRIAHAHSALRIAVVGSHRRQKLLPLGTAL